MASKNLAKAPDVLNVRQLEDVNHNFEIVFEEHGSKFVVCDNKWKFSDYREWKNSDIVRYIENLCPIFSQYSERFEKSGIDGSQFEHLAKKEYLDNYFGILNKNHSSAISLAVKNRIYQFKQHLQFKQSNMESLESQKEKEKEKQQFFDELNDFAQGLKSNKNKNSNWMYGNGRAPPSASSLGKDENSYSIDGIDGIDDIDIPEFGARQDSYEILNYDSDQERKTETKGKLVSSPMEISTERAKQKDKQREREMEAQRLVSVLSMSPSNSLPEGQYDHKKHHNGNKKNKMNHRNEVNKHKTNEKNEEKNTYENNKNNSYFTGQLSFLDEEKFNAGIKPPLPYPNCPLPSLKEMSNRFRPSGPSKILYHAKNGPFALCRRLNEDPAIYGRYNPMDKDDELLSVINNNKNNSNSKPQSPISKLREKYKGELNFLSCAGFCDDYRNLRGLLRHNGDRNIVINELLEFDRKLFVGDIVVRGPDWKWGDQDGGKGSKGIVRGITRWHPNDSDNKMTACIVVWEHGLYGNYRFNYKGAFDVRVINDDDDSGNSNNNNNNSLKLSIGDRVMRKQRHWRWGEQDGGAKGIGTVIEIFAAPSTFDCGAMIGVLWDKDRLKWKNKALKWMRKNDKWNQEYKKFLTNYGYDINDNENKNDLLDDDEFKFEKNDLNESNDPNCVKYFKIPKEYRRLMKNSKKNRHKHRNAKRNRKYALYNGHKQNMNMNMNVNVSMSSESESESEIEENSSDWEEIDFDEMLSKPIPKYRWFVDGCCDIGLCDDNDNENKNQLKKHDIDEIYIGDVCKRGPQFDYSKYSKHSKFSQKDGGIVLKIEQWDSSRVLPNEIVGDKIWINNWSLNGFKFGFIDKNKNKNMNLNKPIYEMKRESESQLFSRIIPIKIRVGDRVERGAHWDDKRFGNENGGSNGKGTVTCITHKLKVTSLIVRVRWHRNDHINQYSWGYKNIFDLRKI